jgi:hypothetical protein
MAMDVLLEGDEASLRDAAPPVKWIVPMDAIAGRYHARRHG